MRVRPRLSLQVTILSLFLIIVVPLTAVIIVANYRLAREGAVDAAGSLVAEVSRTVTAEVEELFQPAANLTVLVPLAPTVADVPAGADHPALALMRGAVAHLPNIASIYLGYEDGGFLRLINFGDARFDAARRAVNGPEDAVYAVQVISTAGAQPVETWHFFGSEDTRLAPPMIRDSGYDPRTRPWFQAATGHDAVVVTRPYVFSSSGETGVTVSRRAGGQLGGVIGVDLTLAVVSEFLADLKAQWAYPLEVAVFDDEGRVIASSLPAPTTDGEFAPVDALGDAGLSAAVAHYFETGAPYDRAVLRTARGRAVAAVHRLPLSLGEGVDTIAIAAPLEGFVGPLLRASVQSVVLSLIVLLLTLPAIFFFSRRLSQPLRRLAAEADRIRNFDLDEPLTLRSRIAEVRDLIHATDLMKATVSTFAKYVPRELVRGILQSDVTPEPGGERRPVTLMITDIEGFTPLSEQLAPEALMHKMSAYLETMVGAVLRQDGTVDKYVGDAIMAYWNAPALQADHAARGCLAALACRDLSDAMNEAWAAKGEAELYTRFGLHSGECIVGNFGSSDRIDFTVVGAPVNLTSRLEGLNKHYGTQVLLSEAVRSVAGGDFVTRPVDIVLPAGAVKPIPVHELLGVRAGTGAAELVPDAVAGDDAIARSDAWRDAYDLYLARDWTAARAAFEAYAARYAGDTLAALYVARVSGFEAMPPHDGWDGVARFDAK